MDHSPGGSPPDTDLVETVSTGPKWCCKCWRTSTPPKWFVIGAAILVQVYTIPGKSHHAPFLTTQSRSCGIIRLRVMTIKVSILGSVWSLPSDCGQICNKLTC